MVTEENDIRKKLLYGNSEIGLVVRNLDVDQNNHGQMTDSLIGIMPQKMYDLGIEYGIGFTSLVRIGSQGDGTIYYSSVKFKSYDECSENEKRLIENRLTELALFKKQVHKSNSDKKMSITLPIYPKQLTSQDYMFDYPSSQNDIKQLDSITLSVTKRELAEADLLPSDFEWPKKHKAKISRKDIAEADKEHNLTSTEVKKVKALIAKIRNLFRGNGEK